jgi:hypothetical protein
LGSGEEKRMSLGIHCPSFIFGILFVMIGNRIPNKIPVSNQIDADIQMLA